MRLASAARCGVAWRGDAGDRPPRGTAAEGCGEWREVCGEWREACGEWREVCGEWREVCG
eukprot:gene8304-21476_t